MPLKTSKKEEVTDGLYLFYVKDEQIYPVVIDNDGWELLQRLGTVIAGGTVQVIDKPMGKVERLK